MPQDFVVPSDMTLDEFVAWSMAQSSGCYELVDGKVIAMPSEGGRHNLVKGRIFRALEDTLAASGLPGTVFTDGMTVKIDGRRGREPDALVTAATITDLDTVIITDPLIVVEVVSPSSEKQDLTAKLIDYFAVPSIRHYLIVQIEQGALIHHRRDDSGDIRTSIHHGGAIRLDPPGLVLPIDAVLAAGR